MKYTMPLRGYSHEALMARFTMLIFVPGDIVATRSFRLAVQMRRTVILEIIFMVLVGMTFFHAGVPEDLRLSLVCSSTSTTSLQLISITSS